MDIKAKDKPIRGGSFAFCFGGKPTAKLKPQVAFSACKKLLKIPKIQVFKKLIFTNVYID